MTRHAMYRWWTVLGSLLVLAGCSTTKEPETVDTEILKPIREKYAPDGRLAVFTVTLEKRNDTLIAGGDVDQAAAKQEVLDLLTSLDEGPVVDEIKVLPDPKLGDKQFGVVTVSVGSVRTRPSHAAELSTQALMGTVVKLLKKQRNWYYVQLPDDYIGWLPERSVVIMSAEGVEAWRSARKVITTSYVALVREKADAGAVPVCDVTAGVLMKHRGIAGGWVLVELPDGRRGCIEQMHVQEYNRWRKSRMLTPSAVERTGKLFMGVPYLWGGTSAKGMDCSGFTKMVFRLNGLELKRDADQQSHEGEEIDPGTDFENLQKGDLLFFGDKATEESPENVDHAGISLGKTEFIHTPGGGYVRIDSFDPAAPNYNDLLKRIFLRARRVIGTKQVPEVAAK